MTIIPHNQRVTLPRQQWFLAAGSGPLCFIFLNIDTGARVERTPADGWTLDDAHSFHRWLMGWYEIIE
jgi:hypothetical protein